MDRSRLRRVWTRVFSLAWPVMAEQTFRTAMRTTDILVTALFSPAAVVAIGLADLYARFPLRIGVGRPRRGADGGAGERRGRRCVAGRQPVAERLDHGRPVGRDLGVRSDRSGF